MQIRAMGAVCVLGLRLGAAEPPPLPTLDPAVFDAPYSGQAARALEQAKTHPDDAEAAGSLGSLLLALNHTEQAAACYQRANALAPNELRWTYYLAVALEELGRRREALHALEAARASSGAFAPYSVRLGRLLREEGHLDEAARELEHALELQPDLPSAHFELGKLRTEEADWEQAIATYEKAVQLARNFAAAHYALGLAYRRAGEADRAKRALERYQQLKPTAHPTFDPLLDAVAALRSGSMPDATAELTAAQKRVFIEELERSLRANPELVSAHANLIALYAQLGDAAEVEEHYKAAVAIDPAYADAHYNWGGAQMARGNQTEALAAFERTLQSDPHHAGALVQSGLLIEKAGHGDEAEKRYRAALEANPVQRQAHYLLARRLVGKGELAEAATHLEETVRIQDETTPSYLRALASTYLRMGRVEDARARLEEGERQALELGRSDLAQRVRADMARLPE